MGFFDNVTTLLSHDLGNYIADRTGLDAKEVSLIILDYLGENSTHKKPVAAIIPAPVKTPPIKPAVSGEKKCIFVYTRGENEGQRCGTSIRGKGNYCSKHKNRKSVANQS